MIFIDSFQKYKSIIMVFALIVIFLGCKSNSIDLKDSPKVVSYSINAENDGTEKSQFVTEKITYDRDILVKKNAAKELKITIGGDLIENSRISVISDKEDERVCVIKVLTNGVTDGKMNISSKENDGRVSGIVSKNKKVPVIFTEMHCLIPTGVKLKSIEAITGNSQQPARVTKQVISTWKVRGIAWILLLSNGKPVPVDGKSKEAGTDENIKVQEGQLDGAIAVHGHDFMNSNNESTAKDIEKELKENFGDRYEFTAKNDTFTVQSKAADNGTTLDVQVLDKLMTSK